MPDFFTAAEDVERVWTGEQNDIFSEVRSLARGGTLAVRARAGTGKTSTAIESLFYARREEERNVAMFLAFNAKNGEELHRKTPRNVKGATFHSTAMAIVRKEPDVGKLWGIVKQQIEGKHFKLRSPAVQLASLGKNLGIGLIVPDELHVWEQLIGEYGIRHQKRFSPEEVAVAAQRLFQESLRRRDTMDFDDFIYTVARDGVGPGFTPLDWLYIDEFQDTNPTQMLMIDQIRAAADGETRLVLLGDPKQAIYGWRGAGVHSFDLGVKRYKAKVLPLTTSWRCPTSVIRSAQELVPDIRARPDAPVGDVRDIWARDFDIVKLADGDVVLCRNNAPLFELALDAVDRDRSVHIAGKGLDKKILAVFERIFGRQERRTRDSNDASAFSNEIIRIEDEYKDRPFAKAMLLDEVQASRALWGAIRRKTLKTGEMWKDHKDFYESAHRIMDLLFFDPEGGRTPRGVILSTIHMAKGMEWDRVYFYQPELIPAKAAQKLGGWHLEQEYNLDYVARTRSKRELIFVRGAGRDTSEDPIKDEGDGLP